MIYSGLPRRMTQRERKAYADGRLRDIKARQRAGMPDPPLQVAPEEHRRIFDRLVKEGKKARVYVPGRPTVNALTQEDYWEAVRRGI